MSTYGEAARRAVEMCRKNPAVTPEAAWMQSIVRPMAEEPGVEEELDGPRRGGRRINEANDFQEALPGYLPSDPASQKRLPALRGKLKAIVGAEGYANIVESRNDWVEGILFEISATDEATLDKKEGVAVGSYRKVYLPLPFDGKDVTTLVYVDPIATEGIPKDEYPLLAVRSNLSLKVTAYRLNLSLRGVFPCSPAHHRARQHDQES